MDIKSWSKQTKVLIEQYHNNLNAVLFKSQNGSTWTEQNEDAKFKIKRAEFSNVTGVATFCNDALPVRTLATNPIRTTSGSDVIRISHPNHGYAWHIKQCYNCRIRRKYKLQRYFGSSINGTYTSISNVTLDSYEVSIADSTTATKIQVMLVVL